VIQAEFRAAAAAPDQLPPPALVEVAFAGRSNVGKSSLLNCLMSRKSLARTSSTPGCTRQITFFEVVLGDKAALELVDLPGYGYARRSKTEREVWADLIEHYLLRRVVLRAFVLLVDARRGLEREEHDLIEMMSTPIANRPEVPCILVATKVDKIPAARRKAALLEVAKGVAGRPVLGFSAVTGLGRDELWARVRRAIQLEPVAT
jgi:GTP-binding protein